MADMTKPESEWGIDEWREYGDFWYDKCQSYRARNAELNKRIGHLERICEKLENDNLSAVPHISR